MTNEPELEPFTFRGQKDLRGHLSRQFKEKGRQWVEGPDHRAGCFFLPGVVPLPPHPHSSYPASKENYFL